jgi:hypothetical protein
MVLNWRRTSSTMARAALPTDFMVIALNQNGSIEPTSRPAKTWVQGSAAGRFQLGILLTTSGGEGEGVCANHRSVCMCVVLLV